MKLTLVTPEKKILTGQEVESILVPAFRGELNILDGHTPLITTLDTGIMKWKIKGQDKFHYAVVSWGYCEVFPNGVDILAEVASLPEDVNLADCEVYLAKTKSRLATESLSDDEYEKLSRGVKRAEADMAVIKYKN